MIPYLDYMMVSGITKHDDKSYFCLNVNFIINHTLAGNQRPAFRYVGGTSVVTMVKLASVLMIMLQEILVTRHINKYIVTTPK